MTIKDRVGQQFEHDGMLGGKGTALSYMFFQGQADPAMLFADIVVEPGAYAGHHRHQGHDCILYVVSGTADHFQEGDRRTLKPGDAVLLKSGDAHAVRNAGDEDLRVLEFAAVLGGELDLATDVIPSPLPDAISDWV
jgi:quercetin dioxygenase-like cupin family protein